MKKNLTNIGESLRDGLYESLIQKMFYSYFILHGIMSHDNCGHKIIYYINDKFGHTNTGWVIFSKFRDINMTLGAINIIEQEQVIYEKKFN